MLNKDLDASRDEHEGASTLPNKGLLDQRRPNNRDHVPNRSMHMDRDDIENLIIKNKTESFKTDSDMRSAMERNERNEIEPKNKGGKSHKPKSLS